MSNLKIYVIFFLLSFIYCDFIFFDTSLHEYYHNYYSDIKDSNDQLRLATFLSDDKIQIQTIHLLREILNQHENVDVNSTFNMTEIWDLLRATEYNIYFYEVYTSWIQDTKYIENDYIQREYLLNYSILLQNILKNI